MTTHHRDDQIEALFGLRLSQGSGLIGLTGVPSSIVWLRSFGSPIVVGGATSVKTSLSGAQSQIRGGSLAQDSSTCGYIGLRFCCHARLLGINFCIRSRGRRISMWVRPWASFCTRYRFCRCCVAINLWQVRFCPSMADMRHRHGRFRCRQVHLPTIACQK